MMIKLFQFPSLGELPNNSPFCMKLETYLRMTKLPFEIINTYDPRKAPKGKLPYIEDDGMLIADSGLIIDYLKKKYGDILDAKLTEVEKAHALALQRLMDEHLYWCMLYSRWIDASNWPIIKAIFFSRIPVLIRHFIAYSVRKNMRTELHGHGLGRHSQDEIYQMGIKDLQALSVILGNNKFMFGDEPTSIDACAYAFIANILYVPISSPMTDYAKAQQNFTGYCERMKGLLY